MKYRVLIFMAKDRLAAIDVGTDGKVDEISIDGNDMMMYSSKAQVRGFCQHIKNYYNIEAFSDLEMSVSVLRFDATMEDTFALLEEIKGAGECNLVGAEKVIAWLALKEGLLKAGTAIQVKAFDIVYSVSLSGDMVWRCQIGGTEGHPFMLSKEKFAAYNHLGEGSLFGYEDEINELCKKYDIELEKKEQRIKALEQQLLDEKKKTSDINRILEEKERNIKRYICRLRSDQKLKMKDSLNTSGFFSKVSATVYGGEGTSRKDVYYLVCCCNSGAIVKKGQTIGKVKVYQEIWRGKDRLSNETRCPDADFVIKAEEPGRIFWLYYSHSESEFEYGSDIAVVGDVSDTKEDAMRWYEKNK